MSTIKIELTLEEANTVLRVLGKHPFEEVVSLIGKIKSQGDPQVAAQEEAAKAAELPAA
jgi:hypothetical protein